MTTLTTPRLARTAAEPAGSRPKRHYATHLVLIVLAVMWLLPLGWSLYTALRPIESTNAHGYFSIAGPYNFDNFVTAWNQGGFSKYFWNSALITVPTVILTLFFASLMAFAVSRVSWKFNIALLILFTAGNLLPPQVLAAPLFQMFKHLELPYWFSDSGSLLNTYISVIVVDTAFQIGFCTFVLSNYMKALSHDLTEAALVDGAGIWTQYWSIIMPLCRPAFAALGTLEVIFIYNDFFWPLLFIQNGDRLPVTTAINNLQGVFLSNYNLLAAGATITVIPTLIIYLVLQRQFVAGLTLGSSKG
ncbi:Binding-protein-dependent transport systems inner membrane component [Sinomonas atrocyanea]|uniref:Binding-protein-dependent transport systems inner membrane component n=1 Tax=Sinomonas atrocyanea TaxID=37927 RepID=A0A127A4Z3_9MICC|nr:carbohydrate ABC transporter permease [Sinomonas atrocyanea]AMM33971.1 Binding-protein-dependent transport systems inner membrane component [Sinomonas atrocyanea]GEB63409.1 ABC transporter permease [Sinomonas atrocyanea]GGG66306.1 ABC transporter permease [Sinomonas atrocyanea]